MKRRRVVHACLPCYTKKQKVSVDSWKSMRSTDFSQCDRQKPCNHCSKRRRQELCTYQWSQSIPGTQPLPIHKDRAPLDGRRRRRDSLVSESSCNSPHHQLPSPLTSSGYKSGNHDGSSWNQESAKRASLTRYTSVDLIDLMTRVCALAQPRHYHRSPQC